MGKIKETLNSPHIHIALAAGISIIALAYFSKHVLPQQIGYLPMAVPPFIAAIFETLIGKYPDSKYMKVWYWVVAVFVATGIVIGAYAI